jgi:hypothetical protein
MNSIKNKIKNLFFMLIACQPLFAMKNEQKPDDTTIKGVLFIVPNAYEYNCGLCICDYSNSLSIKNFYNNPLVQVWAASEESDNWKYHGHPRLGSSFPACLPYSLLKDKKENDTLEIKVEDKKWKIELLCKQMGYRYEQCGNFEKALQDRIDAFIVSARHPYSCEEKLLANRVLAKLENGTITHGIFGFGNDSLKKKCVKYISLNKSQFASRLHLLPQEVRELIQ